MAQLTSAQTLLWFRPLSPLNYTLPTALAQQPWADSQHIPIDILQPCSVSVGDIQAIQTACAWVISSPTAAHLAAPLGAPACIAVMGAPTQAAWRAAGGAEPARWFLSPTGESMGLLKPLLAHQNIAVLRGKRGRNELIEALQGTGKTLHTVAVYDKTDHPQFAQQLNAALAHCPVAVYFSSTDQPSRVLAAAQQASILLCSPVLVSHARVEAAALALGFTRVKRLA